MADGPRESTVEKDPVCGMDVNPASAKHKRDHGGKTYYFCCQQCADKFGGEPQRYLSAPSRSGGVQSGPGANLVVLGPSRSPAPVRTTDPVCGMSVDPATAKYNKEHGAKQYYFCSASCLLKFSRDPEKYLAAAPQNTHTSAAPTQPQPIRKLTG